MSSNPGPSNRTALTTWKDIAQHFDRDVRTVQRWEKEEGLPVHRHVHQRKSSVYAYPEELQQWWQERGAILAHVSPAPPATTSRRWLLWSAVAMGVVIVALLATRKIVNSLQAPASAVFRTIVLDGTRPQGNLSLPLTGDVNGDGYADVVLSAGHAREIYILFGGKLLSSGGDLPATANVVISAASSGWLGATQLGDFNADGLQDILVSHVLAEPEAYRATGKSFILWGREQWPANVVMPGAADVTLRLDWATDARMCGCPTNKNRLDLNGDGAEDVFLMASEYGFGEEKSAGAVFVLYGRSQWPRELEVSSSANVVFRGARTGAGFGGPCALGDFNGDGRTDLAGFSSLHTLWNLLGGRGEVAIFEGRKQWPRLLNTAADDVFRLQGTRNNANPVWHVLADLNGDGLDDLITGWPKFEDDPQYAGEVRIWFGRARRRGTETTESADVVIGGSRQGAQFGHSVTVEDVDKDGLPDLIIPDPGTGQIYLIYGRRDWKKSARIDDYSPAVLFRGETGAGTQGVAFNDLDGDHVPELVFTSLDADSGGENAGRAWIVKPFISVALDVRPEREPNVLLWPGMVVARILGTSGDSQDRINPSTMRLAGAPATRHVEQDYNADGIPDWQVYFDSTAMSISSATKHVVFSARTLAGLPVAGGDAVVVVPQVSSRQPRAAR